jgi:hypothetical protein
MTPYFNYLTLCVYFYQLIKFFKRGILGGSVAELAEYCVKDELWFLFSLCRHQRKSNQPSL